VALAKLKDLDARVSPVGRLVPNPPGISEGAIRTCFGELEAGRRSGFSLVEKRILEKG
jgi:hypothetical protein